MVVWTRFDCRNIVSICENIPGCRRVSASSLSSLLTHLSSLYPGLDTARLLGGYSGLRPASEHQDYCISLQLWRGWVRLASIRSTGLTCSLAIAQYVASTLIEDYKPAVVPRMPKPVVEEGGKVRIGRKVYTPTHPLTSLGLGLSQLPPFSSPPLSECWK